MPDVGRGSNRFRKTAGLKNVIRSRRSVLLILVLVLVLDL